MLALSLYDKEMCFHIMVARLQSTQLGTEAGKKKKSNVDTITI